MAEAIAEAACPLPLDILPANFQKHVDPKAPVPLRMMGAKGLVPMGPKDMATALFMLTFDADAAVRETAAKSAAGLPDRMLAVALRDETADARVLDYYVTALASKPDYIEMLILNTTGTAVAPASSLPPLPDVEAEQAEASAADGDDSAGVTAHYEASDHQGGPHDRGGPAFVRFHAGGGGVERERRLVLGGEAEMGSGERGGKGGCGGSHCGGARGLPGCGLRDGQREDYSAGGEGPRRSKHRRSPCSHGHMLCNHRHLLCNPGHLLPMVCGTAPALLFRVAFYAMVLFSVHATYVFLIWELVEPHSA